MSPLQRLVEAGYRVSARCTTYRVGDDQYRVMAEMPHTVERGLMQESYVEYGTTIDAAMSALVDRLLGPESYEDDRELDDVEYEAMSGRDDMPDDWESDRAADEYFGGGK